MNMNNSGIFRETKQRKRIMEILSSTKSHPTADWVYSRLREEFPSLSLSTVYRNIRILKKQKRILELPFGHTFDRYDGNPAPHPHFACQKCRRVFDIDVSGLEKIFENATKNANFELEGFNLNLYGICNDCRDENASS